MGRLSRTFIAFAFLNFMVGATLGGWMAVQPELWSALGAIHGEINPFGWLTMLIYGMTYAVLSVSAGLRPPKEWVGWVHLATAEGAVVVISLAHLLNHMILLRLGLAMQVMAPIVFLINILSAVVSSRRRHVRQPAVSVWNDAPLSGQITLLQRGPQYRVTDRIAQRGTDVSLMIYIASTIWIFLDSFRYEVPTDFMPPEGALVLVYYGWILGTIFAVGLHLFPRFLGFRTVNARAVAFGQVLLVLSLVLSVVGRTWIPHLAEPGARALGFTVAWWALVYLRALLLRTGTPSIRIPGVSIVAWYSSWGFCLALGLFLMVGLPPDSLAGLHLLFLGFATTLVYGIGYTLFPVLLGRDLLSLTIPAFQVAFDIVGALLMVVVFLWMPLQNQVFTHSFWLFLGIGGVLATSSAMTFLLQWTVSTRGKG